MNRHYYWAHCHDCGEHFETRSGWCGGCHTDQNVKGEDACADNGCVECKEAVADDLTGAAIIRSPEERRADLRLVVGGKG